MGEKIKDLSFFEINGQKVAIELNEGYSKDYSEYDIHIQSDTIQYNLSDSDFMRLVSAVATAKKTFDFVRER
ncbi:hypothetical protein AALB47_22845 [Lachnospiraceae bacterium 54-11]